MKRPLLISFVNLFLFALAAVACAEPSETWMGIYMQGQKIGYSQYREEPAKVDGKDGKKSTALTVMKSQMLGAGLELTMQSESLIDGQGRIKTLIHNTESGGRTLKVKATFGAKSIKAVLDTSGRVSEHTIEIPEGAVITDDPTAIVLQEGLERFKKPFEFYQFDPASLTLIKATAKYEGKSNISIDGKEIEADHVLIEDPRAPMSIYLDGKGTLIRATGPFGLEMYPEPELVAKDLTKGRNAAAGSDIAEASRLVPDKPISGYLSRKSLTLRVTGVALDRLPSDRHQTVTKSGEDLILTVHPIKTPNLKTKISEAAAQQPSWIKPDVRVPSDSKTFKDLATKLIGKSDTVIEATQKVRKYVLSTVNVNAGIGVMRDADEILETKEGVCRDHAILMAAILRAGNIPTKLIAGMVYAEGAFYYHAWVEVWDGNQWVGVDSTRMADYLTATHIKTAEGKVGEAYVSFLLNQAKFYVLPDKDK